MSLFSSSYYLFTDEVVSGYNAVVSSCTVVSGYDEVVTLLTAFSPLLMTLLVSCLGYVNLFYRGNLVTSLGNLALLLVTLLFSWYLLSSLSGIVYSLSHFVSSFSKLASSLDNLVSSLGNLVSSLGDIISSLGNLVSFHSTLSLVPCLFSW